MNEKLGAQIKHMTILPSKQTLDHRNPNFLQRFARKRMLAKLKQFKNGCICISENGQVSKFGNLNATTDETVNIDILDIRFWSELAFSGNTGAGEAYIQGVLSPGPNYSINSATFANATPSRAAPLILLHTMTWVMISLNYF